MHVLVTGIDGFSGRHLVPALLDKGWRVTGVGGRKTKARREHPSLTVLSGDLASDLALPDDIDAVVHMAASSPGPGLDVTDADMNLDNAMATRRLALYARDLGVRSFIYFSSLSVYGRISTSVVDESTPIVDPDVYGMTKHLGEIALAEQAFAFPSLAIRLPGVIGPSPVRNWLSQVMERAKKGSKISIYNPESAFNNAVHINDLCQFVLAHLEGQWRGHESITVGAGGSMPVREVVETIIRGTGGGSRLETLDNSKQPFIVSSDKAIKVFGYQPMDIRKMIERFISENAVGSSPAV